MTCNNCKIKSLCKHYEAFNVPGITLEVKNCVHMQPICIKVDSMTVNGETFKTNSDIALLNNDKEIQPPVQEVRKSRAFQDISQLSNQLRLEKAKEKIKPIDIEEGELENCPTCGVSNTMTFKCPGCGKTICHFCGILAVDPEGSGNQVFVCEECWDKDDYDKVEIVPEKQHIGIEVDEDDDRE